MSSEENFNVHKIKTKLSDTTRNDKLLQPKTFTLMCLQRRKRKVREREREEREREIERERERDRAMIINDANRDNLHIGQVAYIDF